MVIGVMVNKTSFMTDTNRKCYKLVFYVFQSFNINIIFQVTIFQECQPEFLHDLVLKMKAYIFTPGDSICRKGKRHNLLKSKISILSNFFCKSSSYLVIILTQATYLNQLRQIIIIKHSKLFKTFPH